MARPHMSSCELFDKALASEKAANKVDEAVDYNGARKLYSEAYGWLKEAIEAESCERKQLA